MKKALVTLVLFLAAIVPLQPARADLFTTDTDPKSPPVVVPLFQVTGNYGGSANLPQVVQEVMIRVLRGKGYNPLASADSIDLQYIQQELQLQGKSIYEMAGARYLVAGTADACYAENWIQTDQGNGRMIDLKVRIQIRVYDMRRRLAGKVLEGHGSARGISDVDVYQLTESRWDRGHGIGGVLRGLVSGINLGRHVQIDPTRKAVAEAVENALRGQEYGGQPIATKPVVTKHRTDIAVTGAVRLIVSGRKPLNLIVSRGAIHPDDMIYFRRGGETVCSFHVFPAFKGGQDISCKEVVAGTLTGTEHFDVECP